MNAYDPDTDLETLMRRRHHTTEFATAAWAEYQALRDALRATDPRLALAHSRWRAAERERRDLMSEIERLEEVEAA